MLATIIKKVLMCFFTASVIQTETFYDFLFVGSITWSSFNFSVKISTVCLKKSIQS